MAAPRVRVTRTSRPGSSPVPTPVAPNSTANPTNPQGLSLRYLYNQTPALYRNNAADVAVSNVRAALSKGGYPAVTARTTTPTSKQPQVYKTWVVGKEKNKLIHEQPAVMVQCSCANYMFMWEYANAAAGAARVIYGNGEPPIVTNGGLAVGMCVAKGTLITTKEGLVPIEKINIGDDVLTLKGYQKVVDSGCTGVNREVITVTTLSGRTITVTPEHKLYSCHTDDRSARWTEAQNLEPGDHLAILLSEEPSPVARKDLDDLMVLVGYVLSEGGEVGYGPMPLNVLADYKRRYERVFGVQPSTGKNHLAISKTDLLLYAKNGYILNITSPRIPKEIFSLPAKYRISLLYGLFQGDGWISSDMRYSTYAGSYEPLIKDVQLLMSSLGIHATISEEVSGVQGIEMYLLRPTVISTWRLCQMMPLLSKYGKCYFNQDGDPLNLNGREVTLPFSVRYVIESLKNKWVKNNTPSIKNIVTLRQYARDNGANVHRFIALAKNIFSHHILKVKLPGVDKHVYALPEKYAFLALIQSNGRILKSIIPTTKCRTESMRLSKYKLKTLLDALIGVKGINKYIKYYQRLCQDDVVFDEIVSVKREGRAEVYDLTVENAHHFVANSVLTHNCKHLCSLSEHIFRKKM